MPTEAQLYRMFGGGGGMDFPDYQPRRSSLLDLTMAQGQQRAEGYLRSGELWGNAIAGIGQGIGQALEKRSAEKKLRARDAAWVDFVGRGDWANDPKKAYAETVRIWGPEEGPKQFQALAGVSQLMQPKRDQAADSKALGAIGGAMGKMDDAGRAALWPQAVALTKSAFPHVELPEQYDPKVWAHVEPLFSQLSGEKPSEGFTLKPGEQRFGPDGKPIASVPEPPKEPKQYEVTVPGPNGQPIRRLATAEEMKAGVREYRAPREPKEPKDERIVQVMGPNGTPVWVRESQAIGKPAAQAPRAVTGAERQALAYFNRAKTAAEDIAPLEDKVANKSLAGQVGLQVLPNVLQSEENQRYRQAQRAFTEARLRKESGATIKADEYESDAKTYFAQPGDSKEVLAQKRAAREEVLRGLGYAAGRAYEEFYGSPLETPRREKAGPAKPKSKAEFDALPPGTPFIAPDGTRWVK